MKGLKGHEFGLYPEDGRGPLRSLSKEGTGCKGWDNGSEHGDEERSKYTEDAGSTGRGGDGEGDDKLLGFWQGRLPVTFRDCCLRRSRGPCLT